VEEIKFVFGKKHRSFLAERSRSMGKEKEDEAIDD
jgi:hypothetical protein